MPVPCAQCEPALICEENKVPVADLPIPVYTRNTLTRPVMPPLGSLFLTGLSSSPCVIARLLASLPCSWDCAGRHGKPSCNHTFGCTILERLDYLCNLIGLLVQPHNTSSEKDTVSGDVCCWLCFCCKSDSRLVWWSLHHHLANLLHLTSPLTLQLQQPGSVFTREETVAWLTICCISSTTGCLFYKPAMRKKHYHLT